MLTDKNVDLVVYNDVSRADIGFDAKDNEVVLITREGEKRIAKAPKSRIAAAVLDEAVALLEWTLSLAPVDAGDVRADDRARRRRTSRASSTPTTRRCSSSSSASSARAT